MKRVLTIVGAVACIASLAFAGVWAWDTELVDSLVPERNVAAPVGIRLYGPAECLRGSEYFFHVEVSGPAGRPQWTLIPPTNNALRISDDGLRAGFRSLDEGTFSVQVAVAGDARQVASDHIEFENLGVTEPPLVQEPTAAEQLASLVAAMPAQPEPAQQISVSDLVHEALADVASEDQAAEAKVIAGCLRSVIGRVQTGLVAPDTNVLGEVRLQAELALGDKVEAWELFLDDLETIAALLREEGRITTAASAVPTLSEMASAMTQSF